MANADNNILIYRLGSLGDTVMALPVFNKIREVYPTANITLLTNNPVVSKAAPLASVLGNDFFFNQVLTYPVGTRSISVLFHLLKQIRALKIDTLIYLAGVRASKNLFKTRLTVLRDEIFFRLAGIKKIIGLPVTHADYVLSPTEQEGFVEWEAQRLARRVTALGSIELNDDRFWDMHFSAAENEQAGQVLELLAGKPFIAASTGTKNQVNDWEQPNWLKLLSETGAEAGDFKLVMLGGADEYEAAEKCLAAWGKGGLNLCGKTSPRVSGLVMKEATLFIGHDSGPMHLAAAVNIPCVAIFSARHLPGQWFPRGPLNTIIYHRTDCAGCELDVCIAQQKKCIRSITVAEVKNAVLRHLTSSKKPV